MNAITSTPAVLPGWAQRASNLADPRLGAAALDCSDEFFAPLARMLSPEPAVFIPGKYDTHGKWMDGWETRRKRVSGHDWGVIKLARRGLLAGFDVDTSHFTGNYAPAVSIEACDCADDTLAAAHWWEVLPATSLQGNSHHMLEAIAGQACTHLRVHIYPDGGIARLRVYGQPVGAFPDPQAEYDLVALVNGGRVIGCNDAHFGHPSNLLLPGRGKDMGEGWETRRRREPGHDWCILALGAPGTLTRVDVDTAHFKGNFPDRCSIQAALVEGGTDQSLITQSMFWPVLLPEQALSMDALHSFHDQLQSLGPVSHVRFNIHPDGGVSRLRLWGKVRP